MDLDSPPSYFDPQDLSIREQYRRYGKRHSSTSSVSPKQDGSRLLYEGHSIHSPTNAALLLENIKHEADGIDVDYETASFRTPFKRRIDEDDDVAIRMAGSESLKACMIEDESVTDSGETTFGLFASLIDSAIQGLMPIPDLILRFEISCRNVSESIRYGSNVRHRAVEDKLMRQKALLLLDEAATWSLIWHLYGKATEEIPEELILSPSTSHLEACRFIVNDHTAQLCLRIVQWLEGLASKALDLENKVRGSHIGTYLPNSGIWHHTQRFLKKGASVTNTVHHLDFDAPTREHAHQLPDDKKQDESLLEDVWTLIRAGRLEQACELCRSAGQPWRAATLCPFGGMDLVPSVEALVKNGKNRALQALELESGIARQWHLWKWASYCASEKIAEQDGGKYEVAVYAAQCSNLKRTLPTCTDWESACWAMAKSWLDVQVDFELAQSQPGRMEQLKSYAENMDESPGPQDRDSLSSAGPDHWPLQVSKQQPRSLSGLLQKLHSGELVNEAVTRACKEQQRQIEMDLMLGNIPHLLDMIWSWIAPSEDDQNVFRPHGDPQMIRFGAHLVLVLRYLLVEEMQDSFREKLMIVGDLILHMKLLITSFDKSPDGNNPLAEGGSHTLQTSEHLHILNEDVYVPSHALSVCHNHDSFESDMLLSLRYVMFLFSKQHEELVGIYASQLARHRCIDLFVHMMELRLNSSVHVKYKIFISAMEYLPFSSEHDSKGSFEEIIERVLSRSREIKVGKYDKSSDVAEQHRLQSLQKAMVIQWLCFTPPSTITNVKEISAKLLLQALTHSNILFREFALISMWRVPAMPIGAHSLLSLLAEPLKQLSEIPDTLEDYVSENLKEFKDWSEYYSCDATYRNWLKIDLENAEILPEELSTDEKQRAVSAAKEALDSSLMLLRKANAWLASLEDYSNESPVPVFVELHATAMLCLPSGECLHPDATICAALMSALYSSVTEDDVLHRQLMINVAISSRDEYCIEVVLRCLAVENDGLGMHQSNDGGLLGTVMAAGFKGELVRFQAGVTMEISRIDAWYSTSEGSLEGPATYIVKGLCRRCCLPELILRSMQVSVSLMELANPPENHDELIELVSCDESGFLYLFSQQQLQEFLLFEREYEICKMELEEELSS